MPESNIDLILRTKREGNAPQEAVNELTEMHSGLTDLEKSMAGTRTTIGGLDSDIKVLGGNVGSTADLLSGMGVSLPVTPMLMFGEAVGAAGRFIGDSLSEYAEYVKEIDRVSTFTGMASEETSRLIQVAGDLRIETGTLEVAMRTMAQSGVEPSIDGLGRLSDRYLALQSPLERAQFLTDNFGRSGVEMARMMELGSGEIRSMADEVSEYMIVTGKSKEQAEAYILALDNWNDAISALKYQIAVGLLPALTSLLELLTSPSADNAANVINTIFKGTFLESSASKVKELEESWKNATSAVNEYSGAVGNAGRLRRVEDRENVGSAYPTLVSGRAGGGDVFPNMVYKVGEREAEYVTFGAPGTVSPAGAGGSVVNFYYQPVVSLADQAEAQRVLTPFIQEAMR